MSTKSLREKLSKGSPLPTEFAPFWRDATTLKDKLAAEAAIPAKDRPSIPFGFDPIAPKIVAKPVGFKVMMINENAAPLESLVASGRMEFREDRPDQGLLRISIATRLRDTFEGAAITTLRSPDMDPSGGGGGLRPVSDYKIDCQAMVIKIERGLSAASFRFLEDFCHRDVFLWRGVSRRDERSIIQRIHRALDEAGVVLGMLTADSVKLRWQRRPKSDAKPSPKPVPES